MANEEAFRVADLEEKIVWSENIPGYLTNHIDVRLNSDDPNPTMVYMGEIIGLDFTRTDFYGNVRLTRTDKLSGVKDKRIVESWLPFKRGLKKVSFTEEKKIWRISLGNMDYHEGVLIHGKIVASGTYYKERLVTKGIEMGIAINEKLISSVFGPIDLQLKKIYNTIHPNSQP